MTALGYSLPAGCTTLPGEEISAVEITKFCGDLPQGVDGVFWDEDDNLIEQRHVTIPADPHCGIPEYQDLQKFGVGTHAWDDSLSEAANAERAAQAYRALRHGQ